MKVLILAGGFGTRLSEETTVIPKPMVQIGNKPIIWHIMKHYSFYGHNEFIILLGYKGVHLKNYFLNYLTSQSDFTIDLKTNQINFLKSRPESWQVSLIETGEDALTGSRIRKAKKLTEDRPFMLTYGDGVSDINIKELIASHEKSQKAITLSAVQPAGRFGSLEINVNGEVSRFKEKHDGDMGWINAGFFVCEQSVFSYLGEGDNVTFEREPLECLAGKKMINCYKHQGFWKCMDTMADKEALNKMWESGNPSWKIWNEKS